MSDVGDVNPAALTDPHEDPPAPEPRRPPWLRRWFGVVVGGMVLALVAAGVWWQRAVTSDPKLEFPYLSRVNRVEHDATGNPEGIVRKENRLGAEYEMTFRPGQRVFVYSGIRNGGSHAVRIEAPPAEGFYYWGFEGMEVSPDPDAAIGIVTTYGPFRSFTLEPGESRNVRLTYRLAGCEQAELQAGGSSSLLGALVPYRILGVRRTTVIPFRDSVLSVPASGPCKEPITASTISSR